MRFVAQTHHWTAAIVFLVLMAPCLVSFTGAGSVKTSAMENSEMKGQSAVIDGRGGEDLIATANKIRYGTNSAHMNIAAKEQDASPASSHA